jgi:hypothetical protein
MDIMSKFDQVILKNSDSTIQLISMKFLSMILERVKEALNIIMNVPLACDKISTLEAYQQAILRVSSMFFLGNQVRTEKVENISVRVRICL